jgi:hypothetical protein
LRVCSHCGHETSDDAAFCPRCGNPFDRASPPPERAYPARLDVDYPDRPLSRLSTFFRIFAAIPIFIVLGLLTGGSYGGASGSNARSVWLSAGSAGILVLPVVLMLLFRKKYPAWWFAWNLELTRFSNRVAAYLALLDDTYPSTDEEQSVHLELDPPDTQELSRGLPLIKWLLAIPHYFVLFFVGIVALVCVVVAWFAILLTGRYPRWAFDFVVGTLRWGLRVQAYAFLLVTDRYPPFRLGP